MSCVTENTKVVTIALGSLQQLTSLRSVSLSAAPDIIQTMNGCMSQGVDIQLKDLQTPQSLITNFSAVDSRLLVNMRAYFNFTFVLSPHPLLPCPDGR